MGRKNWKIRANKISRENRIVWNNQKSRMNSENTENGKERGDGAKRSRLHGFLRFLGGIACAGLLLGIWTKNAESSAHYTPQYQKQDISHCVEKKLLSGEDYRLLFLQTGLGRAGVDALRRQGRQEKLYRLQENYFAEIDTGCRANTIISREEYLAGDGKEAAQEILTAEDGDILIHFNCHVFGWRCGHAGIVTDAEKRSTLEARVLGSDTEELCLDRWQSCPSFAVLRLKGAGKEERAEIAAYAKEYLMGLPYSLTAGLLGKDVGERSLPSGTHCAHLVWCAYKQFGYDLDSDGGLLVTPRDLYESPLLEVVQVYGMKGNLKEM